MYPYYHFISITLIHCRPIIIYCQKIKIHNKSKDVYFLTVYISRHAIYYSNIIKLGGSWSFDNEDTTPRCELINSYIRRSYFSTFPIEKH